MVLSRFTGISTGILILLVTSCQQRSSVPSITEKEAVLAWADMALFITKNTPANSPTYSSRCFGYIGLAMYESVVHADESYASMAGQLNGLNELPIPEKGAEYSWILSLNAAQAEILRSVYNQTSDRNKSRIDSLEMLITANFSGDLDDATVARSLDFGKKTAGAIFQWSLEDGGHRGYLANFDKKLTMPTHPGCWEPPLYGQSFSHYPLHPHWGRNRTFVVMNSRIPTPEMIRFDSSATSDYAKLFKEVLIKNRELTQTEKEIALWWGDDPGETFTPAGHSYYLARQVLTKSDVPLVKSAETFARVGMAVADAFINCWKWKYIYASERPSSYITKHIDSRWESFWPDPPFPAFPSGHATQAGAVAEVLTDLYGEHFEFTDDAHKNRPRDEIRNVDFKPRSYTSFWQVAEETAMSRFYGGIHTAQDNDVGLKQGKNIGANINSLRWKNEAVLATVKATAK
jgi:hypothetical protein